MPIHTDVFAEAGRCSYSQTWAPTLTQDGEFLNRGSLVLMVSESRGQPLYSELVGSRLDFESQLSWLDKCFKQRGVPPELLVPNQQLAEALATRCPNSQILVDAAPPELLAIREQMMPAEMEYALYSPLQMLGQSKALELYRSGANFLAQEIWRIYRDDQIFRFISQGQEYGLTVGGSSRFQDSGVMIFSSLKEAARHSNPPLACFGAGGPATLHHRDLNFLMEHEIILPRQKHPMFVLNLRDKKGSLRDLRWLLQTLPELARSGRPLAEDGKRRLEWTDLRVKSGRSGLFPAYWDRKAG
ncbi:hypothetical protein JST97_18425 [bacterium]|nr:hypothetical protein [bacterium]